MGLTDRIRTFIDPVGRSIAPLPPMTGFDNLWPYVNFDGRLYEFGLQTTMASDPQEEIGTDHGGLSSAYRGNGIVFACIATRVQLVSQARFQFQNLRKGRPDDFFGTPALSILEHPWPGGSTGDLVGQMEVDALVEGNAFAVRRGGQIARMKPAWVSIIIGSPTDDDVDALDLDARILGYVYYPGGKYSGRKPEVLLREQVAHYAPYPDPATKFRGMSPLSPIVREVMADGAATAHKLKFFENGATPNMVVKRPDSPAPEVFAEWVKLMESGHTGLANAYKTLYLTAGADATVVGKDLQQLEFKVTQGAGETRLAAAIGVHPVVVALSEGMQGSSLNAGNFNSARRLTADKTLWHAWGQLASSLETLVPPPAGSRLWVDPRDIPFLREDRKDAATIQQIKATTISTYITAGYTPESAKAAAVAEDENLLVHTGLVSVQLQPPGTTEPEPQNGKVPAEAGT